MTSSIRASLKAYDWLRGQARLRGCRRDRSVFELVWAQIRRSDLLINVLELACTPGSVLRGLS
ncbi:hypothetical protein [Pseudonocardia artemisiae]